MSNPAETLSRINVELGDLIKSGADLPEAELRGLVTATTLLYSAAVSKTGMELPVADPAVNATDAVVMTCAILRGQDLNPFDLTLWFGRVNTDEGNK